MIFCDFDELKLKIIPPTSTLQPKPLIYVPNKVFISDIMSINSPWQAKCGLVSESSSFLLKSPQKSAHLVSWAFSFYVNSVQDSL